MDLDYLRRKYTSLKPVLTERSRRLWTATEAQELGHGGIAESNGRRGFPVRRFNEVCGSWNRKEALELDATRTRRPGGGRKRAVEKDPRLLADLEALLEPTASGDRDSPLRWTAKSVRALAAELQRMGHDASYHLVADLLHDLHYSQANRKTREGPQHPDRDAQFRYINDQVRGYLRKRQPAISVDTKKELVGDFKNAGREWLPKGRPERVRVHDFLVTAQGKAIPYGIYDLHRNEGWVSVGIDHDTASFAVNPIRSWWRVMGRAAYPDATTLLITADAGGSNGSRIRLWKWELQKFANRTGLSIHVCHLPPGTSKWNKIEHRLFSHIAMNWRGSPLVSLAAVVSLIADTRTDTGLRVRSEIDHRRYPAGVTVNDEQMAQLSRHPDRFHGDWNYVIQPASAER